MAKNEVTKVDDTTKNVTIIKESVTKNDIVDMVINEEIAKGNKLKEDLSSKKDLIKIELEKRRSDLKKDIPAVLSAFLKKSLDSDLKKAKIVIPKTYIPVFDSEILHEVQYEIEKAGENDGKIDKIELINPNDDDRFQFEGFGFPMGITKGMLKRLTYPVGLLSSALRGRLGSAARPYVSFVTEEVHATMKIDEFGFSDTQRPHAFSLLFALDCTMYDAKQFIKPLGEIKSLVKEFNDLSKKINHIEEQIRKIRDKREEVKSGITRFALSQSDEGQEILASMEKIKESLSISFKMHELPK